jgi:hypothetical protein
VGAQTGHVVMAQLHAMISVKKKRAKEERGRGGRSMVDQRNGRCDFFRQSICLSIREDPT